MQGLQLTADLRGCPVARPAMTRPQALRKACIAAVRRAGLALAGELFHRLTPVPGAAKEAPLGITGVVRRAESHLAVSTWPALGAVTLDVHVCKLGAANSARAHAPLVSLVARVALVALVSPFEPAQAEHHALQRGGARLAVEPVQ